MEIEILISTMNKKSISELNLFEKKIYSNCTIINQITHDDLSLVNEEIKEKKIKMISYREKGISKSRNRALENATGDIILLTDDDISLVENSLENIVQNFKRNKNIDILTFQYTRNNPTKNKKYKIKEFLHDSNTIRKVSSVEIAMKRKTILKSKVKYDELFGLGAKYNSGEENIFLKDCLDKGLRIKYIPRTIVLHPDESLSTPFYWTEEYIKGKGPLFYRLYNNLGIFLFFILIIIKKKKRKKISILKAWNIGLKEIKQYIRNEKVKYE